jgi:hypothetical protein
LGVARLISSARIRWAKIGPAGTELAPAGGGFHHHVGPEDVRRHQVGRELDAVERQVQRLPQRPHQQGLAQTRARPRAARGRRQTRAISVFSTTIVLADDDPPDLGAQTMVGFPKEFDLLFDLHDPAASAEPAARRHFMSSK